MRYWIISACILCLFISPFFAQDERTPYEIALERIAEAQANASTELDLTNLGLTELPPEIGNLSNLQDLFLDNNQLSSLPPEIGNLSNLLEFGLSSNQLSSLPPEIGNLSNLQALGLSSNQLSSLPPEIGNLSNLQILTLSRNQLSTLPPEFGNLTCLNGLNLSSNNFRHLPTSLGQLENLGNPDRRCSPLYISGLDISDNPLISPPQEVIDQGTPAILAYLRNQAWWHLQRLIISIVSSIGGLALLALALRWRSRRNRKPKQKRDATA